MPSELRRAAFIDRDGVINVESDHVGRPEDFHLLPHAIEGLRRLQAHGYALVVVTNQAGIAKGLYTEDDYQRVTRHMTDLLRSQQIRLDAVYHCPHHPLGTIRRFAIECDCRKPGPGMLLRAAAEMHLDLASSVLVGDKISDTAAGRAAGLRWTILVRSGHALPEGYLSCADYCCDDLSAAAAWVCSRD
jgi:D-glycero-D-manno-heptose 1,7-bisphosphate phosphatase